MCLASTDLGWLRYLRAQRRFWDSGILNNGRRNRVSAVHVNSDFHYIIKGPGRWLERLKTRKPEEHDEPLTVAWDFEAEAETSHKEDLEEGQLPEDSEDVEVVGNERSPNPSDEIDRGSASPPSTAVHPLASSGGSHCTRAAVEDDDDMVLGWS